MRLLQTVIIEKEGRGDLLLLLLFPLLMHVRRLCALRTNGEVGGADDLVGGLAGLDGDETVPVVAIVELLGRLIPILQKLIFVLVPLAPLLLLLLELPDLLFG